jgi:hypothetical protein
MPTEDEDIPGIYLLYVVAVLVVIVIITLGLCVMVLQ